ncbi:hypothetical protein JW711_00540 [Candidatus Woesearchaeota archaeon]|nr:hypothetical protein [Candidatus Woesearchaeota archaeon]
MVEFNPDGSLKLPGHVQRRKDENLDRMRRGLCMRIRREVVNFSAPKKCILKLTLSEAIADQRFVETIYNYFSGSAKTPTKLRRTGPKEYEVEIETDFRRCSDCQSLINRYKEHLDRNVIEEKGSCTFTRHIRNWSEEDYFD